ncbi:MAG TPA: hypothetical protein VLA00_04820 [Xanthobacteraceae bacterium]|nr:hypothetical protein [Xanthobacteraceae bacterium]
MDEHADIRRRWRQNWLNCIRDFADADGQRRGWLNPNNENPHWSYVEFMCSYFNDILQSQSYDWAVRQGFVTSDEAAAVASMHRLLDLHQAPDGNDYDHAQILADPAWSVTVAEAVRAKDNLLTLLNDDEKRILLASI